LVWGLFHLRVKSIRKKEQQRVEMNRRLAELEHMALRSQMNPHFIFNSLNAVYQYVMEKDIAGANKFITDFSQLIRLTFELTALTKIALNEELEYLHTYLELEKVKYEGQFTSSFSIMPGLDTSAYFLPPMILQPYVENSIRHGVRSVAENGHINIAMLLKDEHLLCIVDDNGAGRQVTKEGMRKNGQHQSRGMSLTAERLSIWSRQAGQDIRVKVEDKVTATGEAAGTRVTVYVPVKEALNPY
jgi:LytS/YehU family sensor histidine kinase